MTVKQILLSNSHNRPFLRNKAQEYKIKELRGLVIHWTANTDKGANAMRTRNYFNGEKTTYGSTHFIVDDKEVIQCIPDEEMAFHVGDKAIKGKGRRRGEALEGNMKDNPNLYFHGVEVCVNKDADFSKTMHNLIQFVRYWMDKHQKGIKDIYRHFDLTGKDCPKMFVPTKVGGELYDWNWDLLRSIIISTPAYVKEKIVYKYKERIVKEEIPMDISSVSVKELVTEVFTRLLKKVGS